MTASRPVREVPMDHTGYVPRARAALTITAAQVQEDDVLLLDVYVSRITRIDVLDPSNGQDLRVAHPQLTVAEIIARTDRTVLLWIKGDQNVARFPHEVVRVIRPDGPSA